MNPPPNWSRLAQALSHMRAVPRLENEDLRASGHRLAPLVLVVEDDGDTRRSIRQLLEDEGYDTEEATNGHAALERLERAPRPALVLLDLMMPRMTGQTVLQEIEARPALASLPIVVMTASGISEATSGLAVPMLRKPVTIDALLWIVEQYSPRFWDDEEAPTEQTALLDGLRTARQECTICSEKAETRCSGCGEAFCRTCFAAGSIGVCARCAGRRGGG